MANRFEVVLKNGDRLDFDGECNIVDYSDPRMCSFLNGGKGDGIRKVIALIPYERILYIYNQYGKDL